MNLTRRLVMGGLAATGLTVAARSTVGAQVTPDVPPEIQAQIKAMRARMETPLPYEIVTVPGEEALEQWQKLKDAKRGWPVIIGDDDDLERIRVGFTMADLGDSEASARGRSPKDILAASAKLSFPNDLKNWSGAYPQEDLTAPIGDWPSQIHAGPSGPSVATDIVAEKYHDQVHILLIPTKCGWEVPAYLRWGDWNACPPPEYHASALRKWHDDFGVELIGINGDTINLRTGNQPKSREIAMMLAQEQYRYCPDIVDQGVETISALAATLMESNWWYLWWD